jgi:hypothetical protein
MKRREFITLLGGAAAAWPLVARAQQGERMRRIGVLEGLTENDPERQARNAAFEQGLRQLGWTEGRNVRIEHRWSALDADRARKYAAELLALGAGSHPGQRELGARTVAAGHPHRTNRVHPCPRSGGCRLCRQPSSARWQRHRFQPVRIRLEREMARAAQRDRTERHARGGASRARPHGRGRPVCRHPVHGAFATR